MKHHETCWGKRDISRQVPSCNFFVTTPHLYAQWTGWLLSCSPFQLLQLPFFVNLLWRICFNYHSNIDFILSISSHNPNWTTSHLERLLASSLCQADHFPNYETTQNKLHNFLKVRKIFYFALSSNNRKEAISEVNARHSCSINSNLFCIQSLIPGKFNPESCSPCYVIV